MTVSWTASDGGSGLAEVDLYAKGPTDSGYSQVASDTSGSGSGSFGYAAAEGSGTYSFYTVATDKVGNVEGVPASPDASVVVTLPDLVAPSSSASSPGSSSSDSLSVSYTASDNAGGSGLAEVDLYAQGPGDSSYSKVASTTSAAASGAFSYTAAEGDGSYSFYTVATDRAGNVENAPASADTTTLVDTTAPTSAATAPAASKSTSVTVSWTASDGGSGLAEVDLYAKGPTDSGYSQVASDTSGSGSGSFGYAAAEGSGTYSFYTVATDKVGNVEGVPASPDASVVVALPDLVAPSSSASSPGSSSSDSLSVSYTASDNAGGSGLAEVDLYAQGPGDSSYSKVASTTSAAAPGAFSYTAAEGTTAATASTTVMTDRAGNVENAPASADTHDARRHDGADPPARHGAGGVEIELP